MKEKPGPLYTLTLYTKPAKKGRIHGAHDDRATLCGHKITERWIILTSDYSGVITCPKCLQVLRTEDADDD